MDRLNAQEKLTICKALNNVQKNKSYYDIVLKINQLLNINDLHYSCFVKFDEIEYIYNSLYQYTKTDCKYSLIKRGYKYYFSSLYYKRQRISIANHQFVYFNIDIEIAILYNCTQRKWLYETL